MNGQRSLPRLGWMILVAAVGLAGAGLTARSSLARDDDGEFSKRTIKGYWGYNTTFGLLVSGAPEPPREEGVLPREGTVRPTAQPTTAMGRIYFDGRGGCEVRSVVNINGASRTIESTSCGYQVSPDGTGTAEAVFPDAPIRDPLPVSFVIVDGARELRFVNTRFIVGAFTARRQ